MAKTTIQISTEVKTKLDQMRISDRDTYNDIIENLIEDSLELSDQAKREIQEALDEVAQGEYISQEDLRHKLGL